MQWPLFLKQSHEENIINCPGEITYTFFPTLPYTTLWSFWNKTLRFTNLETWNVHNSVKYKDIAVCVYENFRIIHLVKSLMNQWLWFWKAWCLGIYFQNNMTPKPLERKLIIIKKYLVLNLGRTFKTWNFCNKNNSQYTEGSYLRLFLTQEKERKSLFTLIFSFFS